MIVFVMVQNEEGEVISRLEVFNSVEVLAPGIELDDVDSLLNSGESNSSSTVICIKYAHPFMPSPCSYF
jgi:2-keto-4-pentenoate hydratase